MLPNTSLYYGFIRVSIWVLRAIAPASTVYCLARGLGYIGYLDAGWLPFVLPWPLEVCAFLEAAFYWCVSLPRQRQLEATAPAMVHRGRRERQALVAKSLASIPDPETFLHVWFRGAPPSSIHRDDVRDLLAWAFFYQTTATACDADELEDYTCRLEGALGRTLPPGRGLHRPSQVSTDRLRLQHKPLLISLLGIGLVDLSAHVQLRRLGLVHYRQPLREFLTVFPLRPQTLFSRHESSAEHVSYWYRPHTSRTRLPVLFIHGIGVGLYTYAGFLGDLVAADAADGTDDGQTGIIALELMPISMRVTRAMQPRAALLAEILGILHQHGWDRFALVGHSYGTIVAAHLLQHLEDSARVGPMLLVDPVAFSMQWGDIPFNFIYRHPQKASEWQLHYFASTDLCIGHSITRGFDWTENVLWREQLAGRTTTVVLASDDIIVDTAALRTYLAAGANTRVMDAEDLASRSQGAAEPGVDVVWYRGLNHSGVFESAAAWRPLVGVLQQQIRVREE